MGGVIGVGSQRCGRFGLVGRAFGILDGHTDKAKALRSRSPQPHIPTPLDSPRRAMNFAGISASLSAIVKPTILRPTLRVGSIASLDLAQLKARGVSGVIIDKDNCLVRPTAATLFASSVLI